MNILNIDKELKNLIPPLSKEEFSLLEESIKNEGLREDIIVWQDKNIIIDGHNRYEICRKNNITFGFKSKTFTDKEEVKEWIVLNQLGRRNLTDNSRTYFWGKLLESRKKRAGEHKGNQYTVKAECHQSEDIPKRTVEVIAKEQNVSKATIERAAQFSKAVDLIAKNCGEEIKDRILAENIKITKEEVKQIAQLPVIKQQEIVTSIENGEHKNAKSLTSIIKQKEKEISIEERKEQIEPKEENKNIQLFQGNCQKILLTIPDKSVDMVLTDPPYAIDFVPSWSSEKWKEQTSISETLTLLNMVCFDLKRICKDNAHLYFFSSWKGYPGFSEIIAKHFDISNLIVWGKNNTSLCDFNKRYAFKHEFIIFAKQKGNNERILNNNQSPDLLLFDRINNPFHSCEKPVNLLEYLVLNSTIENETVLDCFMGTGNTGVASTKNNRKYIGIEIQENFFKEANSRIYDNRL